MLFLLFFPINLLSSQAPPFTSQVSLQAWEAVLFFFFYNTFFFFQSCHTACKILVLQPGIEPRPQQGQHQALTTGPSGNSRGAVLFDIWLQGCLRKVSWTPRWVGMARPGWPHRGRSRVGGTVGLWSQALRACPDCQSPEGCSWQAVDPVCEPAKMKC